MSTKGAGGTAAVEKIKTAIVRCSCLHQVTRPIIGHAHMVVKNYMFYAGIKNQNIITKYII